MLTSYERQLATKAIRRKKLFLLLSIISVIVGLGLGGFYSWVAYTQPEADTGLHFVLVVLILLNARQNLRQYNYAKILESVWDTNEPTDELKGSGLRTNDTDSM